MGNKYVRFLAFAVLLMLSGVVYQKYYRPKTIGCVAWNGNIVEISMRTPKNEWTFDPAEIRVKRGDQVKLDIYNEDTYDHGFAVNAFGVDARLFPERHTKLEFIACNAGEFPFFCSVACGEGHLRQSGKIIVEE